MKKIILSITSILIGAILAITLVLVFYDKKREVYVKSFYNDVRLSFGKVNVKEINESSVSSVEIQRKYYISDAFDFYENNIKTSEYYNSKLVFEDKNEYMYGYIVKDEVPFKYKITDDYIILSTVGDKGLVENYYNLLLCDIYAFSTSISDTLYSNDYSEWDLFYTDKIVTYEDVVELYKLMNQNLTKIEKDVIYLKGYDFYNLSMSNDYIVKIVNINGYAYGFLNDK